MGNQWPWLMLGTGLWTTSTVLMVLGTVNASLAMIGWAIWIALGACLVTATVILRSVIERHAAHVEHIAAIAAREALACKGVRPLRP